MNYIRQAIDSVLLQKTDFAFEIVIADDCSTDGTIDILLEYRSKEPELFTLLLRDKNVGPAKNWFELISFPKTTYIAYLEGDDYWVDENKLQKQVSFMMDNPDYSLTANQFMISMNGKEKLGISPTFSFSQKYSFPFLTTNWCICSSSLVFRTNSILRYYNESYLMSKAGDLMLVYSILKDGYLHIFSEPMSVYRKHNTGQTHLDTNGKISFFINMIATYQIFVDEATQSVDRKHYQLMVSGFMLNISDLYIVQGETRLSIRFLFKYFKYNKFFIPSHQIRHTFGILKLIFLNILGIN